MPSRRDLLLGAAAGLALTGCGSDEERATVAPEAPGAGDLAVLGFALTLEVIERDLYAEVVRSGPLRGEERRMAERFGAQEAEHADVLTAVLRRARGDLPEIPAIDFERLAAGGRREVLGLLAEIEDLGADAYLGAAPDVLDRDVLALALSIHSVEARHAASMRRRLGRTPTPEGAFAAPVTPPDVQRRLGSLLGAGA